MSPPMNAKGKKPWEIIYAKVNDEWKASWIDGDAIDYRNLYWYEWPFLRFYQVRNFITSRSPND